MSLKATVAGVLMAVVAAVSGYWYYSPMLSMKAMQNAAQQRDADTFNQHVDYERLRESFKGQMSAMMAEQLGKDSSGGAQALGAMLGLAMVNQFVDALVRPEVVMRAMQSGDLDPGGKASQDGTSSDAKEEVRWEIERKGFNRVIAYGMEPGETDTTKAFGVVFERYGFSDWKMTEIRIPAQVMK